MPESRKPNAPAPAPVQIQVNPGVDYVYRDFFNLFAGLEEVVVEFGNRSRTAPNQAAVGDRIVMSIPNAIRLRQALQDSLDAVQKKVRELQAEAAQGKPGASEN